MTSQTQEIPQLKTDQVPYFVTPTALFLAALWGATSVATKYAADTWPPLAITTGRFLLAALFMVGWCRFEGTRITIRRSQFSIVLITGVLSAVQLGTFTTGVSWSNASHGTLLINTFVFWVVLIEQYVTHGDHLSLKRWMGLLLSASGVLLILSAQESGTGQAEPSSLAGDLSLVISAIFLAILIVYKKWAIRSISTGPLVFWQNVIAMVLLGTMAAATEKVDFVNWEWSSMWGLLYQGLVVSGFCFAMHTYLLGFISATRLSVFSFTTPLFGLVLAILIRGDQFTPWIVISGLCVAAGIYLVNRTPKVAPEVSVRMEADLPS